MTKFWQKLFATVPDNVRIELVDMLFQTRVPLAIAGVTLIAVSGQMAAASGNLSLYAFSAVVAVVTVFRLACDVAYHRRKGKCAFGIVEAIRWERLYTWSSFAFAGLISLLGTIAFCGDNAADQLLATALVFGYAAGIVCRISVRPAIALPALMLVALPTAFTALVHAGDHMFYAVILVAFLFGSFETVRFIYVQNVAQISLRHEFAVLARQDALTGLANRLGFQERLSVVAARARAKGDLIAVHSIDLDRFKDVNDRYGHPVGDALLQAVAGRLNGILRDGDFAVRMGGDEFVVVQSAVGNREEATLLGRRIIRMLSEPFMIDGLDLTVGASVGVAIGREGVDPKSLMPAADTALYASKTAGRNRVTFARSGGAASYARAG